MGATEGSGLVGGGGGDIMAMGIRGDEALIAAEAGDGGMNNLTSTEASTILPTASAAAPVLMHMRKTRRHPCFFDVGFSFNFKADTMASTPASSTSKAVVNDAPAPLSSSSILWSTSTCLMKPALPRPFDMLRATCTHDGGRAPDCCEIYLRGLSP